MSEKVSFLVKKRFNHWHPNYVVEVKPADAAKWERDGWGVIVPDKAAYGPPMEEGIDSPPVDKAVKKPPRGKDA